MRTAKKLAFIVFGTALILIAAAAVCSASTYSAVTSVGYKNELVGQYGFEMKIPFVQDTLQDNVNTSSGDLSLSETDLTLPGKNGFDVNITRTFNSSAVKDRYSYQNTYVDIAEPSLYCYQYRNESGGVYWIGFRSEENMLENAAVSFTYDPSKLSDARVHQSSTITAYSYDLCFSTKGTGTFTRIPNTFRDVGYQNCRSPYNYSDVGGYGTILTWEFNMPRLRKSALYVDSDTTWSTVEYYGEFYDGESTYPVEFTRRYDKRTEEYSISGFMVTAQGLKGYTATKDASEDPVAVANNLGNCFYLCGTDGVKFYFNCETIEFLGKADKFGNFIRYNGWEITDTMGRVITVSRNGIKVVEDGTERWPIRYSLTKTPYAEDTALDTKTPYVFKVEKTELYGENPVVSTTTYDMYKRNRDLTRWSTDYYEIRKITYPTGAYIEYDYDKVKIYDITKMSTLNSGKYYITKSRINQSVLHNGTQTNTYQYTYNKPNDGYPTNRDYIDGERKKNYRFTTTKKNLFDNVTHTYTFDFMDKMTKDVSSDTSIPTYEYDYGDYWDRYSYPPIKTTETYKGITKKSRVTEASYNSNLDPTWQKDGNYEINTTYNQYGLLLTKTYKRDANTTVLVRNTESTDKKTIIKSETLENNVVKSVTDYEYDSYGNVNKETLHPSEGEEIVTEYSYTYNSDGTSSVSQTIKNVADADGANPADITTTVNYDFWGNASSMTDGRGNSTTSTYDALGRPLTETYPDNTSKGYYYNSTENYIEYTQQNGNKIKYQYDPVGRLTEIYLQQGSAYRKAVDYTYDPLGRKITETEYRSYNASGTCTEKYTTSYEYDVRNRVTKATTKNISNAVVFEKAFAYDETSSASANYTTQTITGDATITPAKLKSEYDLRGVLKAEQILNGTTEYLKTEYTHDFLDNVLTVIDDKARDNNKPFTVKYEYDYAGRAVKETDIEGNFKTTTYDAAGRKTSETDYMGTAVNYFYDAAGRLVKTTAPVDDTQTSEQKTYYDANGNAVKTLTAAGATDWRATATEYDVMNRPTAVKTYPQTVTGPDLTGLAYDLTASYTYNSMGSVLTQGGASSMTYEYNGLNQVTKMTDPENKSETYEYNLLGLPTKKTDRKGIVTTYAYNVWKNPTSIVASLGSQTQSVTYTYDILGNRKSMTDNTGTTTYNYDFLSRLTTETHNGTIKTYEWDKYGNKTGLNITFQGITDAPPTYDIGYSYNQRNLLSGFTSSRVNGSYSYDANGRVSNKNIGGFVTNYTYNQSNAVTELEINRASDNMRVFDASYEFERSGNIVLDSSLGVNAYAEKTYNYDGKNRLKSESIYAGTAGESSVTETRTYQFDSHDNIQRKNVDSDSPSVLDNYYEFNTFSGNNKLHSVEYEIGSTDGIPGLKGASFDTNGNMTTTYDNATIEYDLFNRMVKYEKGTDVYTYTYNGDGQRMSKTVHGFTTKFVWDGMNMVYEYIDAMNNTWYYYGNGVEVQLSADNLKEMEVYNKNAYGDIVSVNGWQTLYVVGMEFSYDAYGNEIEEYYNADGYAGCSFRYRGEYYDGETGFYYLRNRYYDPKKGRFITEDPIRDGTNWYTYCAGNPVMFVDPIGTDAYLFIGLDQADRADAEKAELEKKYGEGKVHVRIIKNREDFQKAWNGMGNVNGQEVPIELAEIHMHGESGYIEDVDMKELKNDRTVEILVLSSCNTGHLDVENNVAVQFLNQQNVNMVIAPDGTHYKAKLGGNLRIKVWSDPNYDTSFSKDLKKMRENQGMVKFTKNQDGTISKKILGREFENINELLAKATSDESMTGIISLHEWYHIQRTLLTPPLIVGGIVLWKH